MFKRVINFFDKFEDVVRGHLSKFPIIYTIIGGIAIVLFWRGVWHTADMLQAKGGILGFLFYEPVNLLLVIAVLLATGLFVSYFIGDTILMSGLRKEKKIHEKTEKEIKEEEATLNDIRKVVIELKKDVGEIKSRVEADQKTANISIKDDDQAKEKKSDTLLYKRVIDSIDRTLGTRD